MNRRSPSTGSAPTTTETQPANRTQRVLRLLPGAMLAGFAFVSLWAASYQAPTFDEVTHLPAGYMYWKTSDYRINAEHPPLLKRLAALPLLFMDLPADPSPYIDQPNQSIDHYATQKMMRTWYGMLGNAMSQYDFGNTFLYPVKNEVLKPIGTNEQNAVPPTQRLTESDYLHNANRIMFWARVPMVMIACGLGALIYCWAFELFGRGGALLALGIFCCEPNFLAHAPLVTTDVGIGAFFVATLYCLWRAYRKLTIWVLIALWVCCGCALVAKYSSLILLPMAVLIGVVRVVRAEPWSVFGQTERAATWPKRLQWVALTTVSTGLAGMIMIWATYGFRFSMVPDPRFAATMEAQVSGNPMASGHPATQSIIWTGARTRSVLDQKRSGSSVITPPQLSSTERLLVLAQSFKVLPEAYLHGFAFMRAYSHGRSTFMRGESNDTGFASYFVWTHLLKTPLVIQALMLAAVVIHIVRRGWLKFDGMFLVIPLLVYAWVTLASHVNIGHRHLLPAYPFVFVLCGVIPGFLVERFGAVSPRKLVALGIGFVLSTQFVLSTTSIVEKVFPNYLPYFNELAGGPSGGYRMLVDSNTDWGQGVKALGDWMRQHDVNEPIGLAGFGTADPQFHGVMFHNLEGLYPFRVPVAANQAPPLRYVAVHATSYQGVYVPEEGYQRIKELLKAYEFKELIADSVLVFERKAEVKP